MRKLLLLPLLLFLLVNCIEQDDNTKVYNGAIDVQIYEQHLTYSEIAPPTMLLRMATEELFGCSNYTLVSSRTFTEDAITIDIEGVSIGSLCLTATGPAVSLLPLNLENGDYDLTLINGDTTQEFTLFITDEYINVTEVGDGDAFNFDFNRFYRYPERTFAVVGGTNTDNTDVYENFLDSLNTKFEVTEFSFPDNGVIPYPDSGSGHWVDYPSSFFSYPDEEEYYNIGQFMLQYSRANVQASEGVSFVLYNWRNDNYRSWQ